MPEQTTVLRPSALLRDKDAHLVLLALEERDVSRGGVWSASAGLWQRYDQAWNGEIGGKGDSQLVGTIGIVYGTPSKYDITIYRVTVTEHGLKAGWSVESLCDDALKYADLTLANCPRTTLTSPAPDPFRKS
ncbi:MAG: hypothetical protein ABR549_05495 [Mycobacteriales bacterium]